MKYFIQVVKPFNLKKKNNRVNECFTSNREFHEKQMKRPRKHLQTKMSKLTWWLCHLWSYSQTFSLTWAVASSYWSVIGAKLSLIRLPQLHNTCKGIASGIMNEWLTERLRCGSSQHIACTLAATYLAHTEFFSTHHISALRRTSNQIKSLYVFGICESFLTLAHLDTVAIQLFSKPKPHFCKFLWTSSTIFVSTYRGMGSDDLKCAYPCSASLCLLLLHSEFLLELGKEAILQI